MKSSVILKDLEPLTTRLETILKLTLLPKVDDDNDEDVCFKVVITAIDLDKVWEYVKLANDFIFNYDKIPQLLRLRNINKYFKPITSFCIDDILFKYYTISLDGSDKEKGFISQLKDSFYMTRALNGGVYLPFPLEEYTWKKEMETYAQSFENSIDRPRFVKVKNPELLPKPYENLISTNDTLFRWTIAGCPFYFKNAEEGTLGILGPLIKHTDWEWVEDGVLPIKFFGR